MKVFLQYRNGHVKTTHVDLNTLSGAGILFYDECYFTFECFVHGENAVRFNEAVVAVID